MRLNARNIVKSTPCSDARGLEYLDAGPDCASMRLPWRQDLAALDGSDILASGAIASLIDQACGLAVMARFGRLVAVSTLNLKIDHLRTADPHASVTVEARCYHATRNVAFVRADVIDGTRRGPVAAAQGSFAFRSDAPGGEVPAP